jgi:hypothetical protein
MPVPGIEDVTRRLRESQAPGVLVGAGASEEELTHAEQALGTHLSEEHRRLLAAVGWALVGPLTVFGLGPDVPADADLIRAAGRRSRLPEHHVPVGEDADGSFYLLDTQHRGPYASPVYVLAPSSSEPAYTAHDLASWLWIRLEALPG